MITLISAKRLRDLRKEKGLTQKELSEHLDLCESSVRKLESGTGNPQLHTLRMVSAYYGKDIGWLVGDEASLPHPEKERFRDRLRRLRLKLGIPREDLIYGKNTENGGMIRYAAMETKPSNPTFHTLKLLSERFGLTVGDLVDGTID